MRIDFLGAINEVTGSKFLVTTQSNIKILLDCGMYQGKGLDTDAMNRDLGFNIEEIDVLILSHAHIDHSGLIPYIVKNGFKGKIYCTHGTRDLCSIMLPDSGKIQETDVVDFNKKRSRIGLPAISPIYTSRDAFASLKYFISMPNNLKIQIEDGVQVMFSDTGHMLGGSAITLYITENGKETVLTYTGDIGRYNKYLLKDPDVFPQSDYIITESTYGNREHEKINIAEEKLAQIVQETCVQNLGKLLIPSFAIGRSQEIIYILNKLKKAKRLPDVPIFVDSPLAISATDIYRLHTECFKDDIVDMIHTEKDPFGFDNLFYVRTKEDSKRLNTTNRPCVIISASGMMEAGRIKHHLANNIENRRTTVLVVGYCAPTTLGHKIASGEKKVSIFGNIYQVNAQVREIDALSGHGDYIEMHRYLSCQDKSKVKNVFLVHGERDVQEDYKNYLESNGFPKVSIPVFRESFQI
ncbi:MAG TPA: MBL fold metallo-hydrolase [Bacteroidales bacterium]|nr:MBL fold metallo-hydrolase [Bacteroidales bacterium]HOR81656.1 MBL fold metallo-hydrolase [Bacteroidales bacterium]HPJ90888.1 MBL fold metallo-hydrolase [Bacteroidales bacterium]